MTQILAAERRVVEATSEQSASWRKWMKSAFRDGRRLCEHLGIDPAWACSAAVDQFPVFAPLPYVNRMRTGDPHDPLLRQVLASHEEVTGLQNRSGTALEDPVGDLDAERAPGLLQKYRRRVLLITTGACAVHCRYCFRRHYPYDSAPKGQQAMRRVVREIARDPNVDEVILSGGDPLTLADDQLAWLVAELNAIEHVKRIRLHTRVPVVIPDRVCQSLVEWVAASRAVVYVVLHVNHAQEIDNEVAQAIERLWRAGASLLNQAVLLHGVNDSFDAQRALCLALADLRVLPYYLHQLDPVRGGMHFEVSDRRAVELHQQLLAELPGYAVPRLVREIAGEASKSPLN